MAKLACVVVLVVALVVVGVSSGAARKDAVSAKLRGGNETTKGSTTGFGNAAITLNSKTGKVCWTLSVHRLDKLLSAHIHKASPGKSGPVVVPLGARFSSTGCVTSVPKKTINAILARPSAYYVNVHTKKFLNGAIRGQLKAS